MSDGAISWALRQEADSAACARVLLAVAKLSTAKRQDVPLRAVSAATGIINGAFGAAVDDLRAAGLILVSGDAIKLSYAAPQPAAGRSGLVTLAAWRANIRASGERLLCSDDPIYAYADEVGIETEMILVQWHRFVQAYTEDRPDKTYVDWRATFRNSVRGNWFRLWSFDDTGAKWTSNGLQSRASCRAAVKARAQHDGANK